MAGSCLIKVRRNQFEVAAITVAELWHGVERAAEPHKSRRREYLQAVLAALPIVAYTEQTAYEHARIWARLAVSRQNDWILRSHRGSDPLWNAVAK